MAKRPKYSRWRRLPGVYRFGDQKWPDPNQELQRISLYIAGEALDYAEAQALRRGYPSAQEYCTEILLQGIEAERVREQVADVESRRGVMEGLHEIADDPEYLAELSEASVHGEPVPVPASPSAESQGGGALVRVGDDPASSSASSAAAPLSPAAWVVLRHAGQSGPDPLGFLACLRRGETVPPNEVAELAQALHQLEWETRGAPAMDRRLSFALHRLAFESQILHTDAWPLAFDPWTVDMLRSVQEAVERILSGQDIRYYAEPGPLGPAGGGPETVSEPYR